MSAPNRLYFGDCLDVLREDVADASVDLVYLAPPFNSKRDMVAQVKGGSTGPGDVQAFNGAQPWPAAQPGGCNDRHDPTRRALRVAVVRGPHRAGHAGARWRGRGRVGVECGPGALSGLGGASRRGDRVSRITALGRPLAAIGRDVDRELAELSGLARRAVGVAWRIGGLLLEARSTCGHGEWRPWLAARGISKSSADRWMQLRCSFAEMSQLGTIGSVDAALKARPKALPPAVIDVPATSARDGDRRGRPKASRPAARTRPRASLTLPDADKRRLVEAAARRGLSQAALLRAALAAFLAGGR